MVMEKSWNMKNCQKVMDFVLISHGILPILLQNVIEFVLFSFADIKKFSIGLESLHFRTFPRNVTNAEFEPRYGHGKLRNGHGKVMFVFLKQFLLELRKFTRADIYHGRGSWGPRGPFNW